MLELISYCEVTLEDKKSQLRVTWRKKGFEIIVYSGDGKSRKREIAYRSLINKDPKQIAQVLLDLEIVDNFPIYEAVKIYLQRRENKDWLGF